jgi:hypothetical protein
VIGAGTTTSFSNYRRIDENPFDDDNYYCLKQIDFDGKYSFSDIQYLNFKDFIFKVYPNPIRGFFKIANPHSTAAVTVADMTGEVVISKEIEKGVNQIDASRLKSVV